MLGAIIGDIVGSRFEFNNHRSKKFDLFAEGCFVTDDSIMTLAVAKAIMEAMKVEKPFNHDYGQDFYARLSDLTVKNMQGIGRKYPNCGFGGMFYKWVFSKNPNPYNSFGNGAAMRVSPAGYAAKDEWEAEQLAEAVTKVTHNHDEGIKGAKATAVAIVMARRGALKSEIRDRIVAEYYPLDFRIDDIRDTYRFNATCQETVPQAIECFLESTSFEDAIRTAISLGGDSDTIAAITGAIAEVYYGIPDEIKVKALTYLDEELLAIYNEWKEFYPSNDEQFRVLTKYIGRLSDRTMIDNHVVDYMAYFPFAEFESEWVHSLYPDYAYGDSLAAMGVEKSFDSITSKDVSDLGSEQVLTLITAAFRDDHFDNGAIMEYFSSGAMLRWLKRMKDIDWQKRPHRITEVELQLGGYGGQDNYRVLITDEKAIFSMNILNNGDYEASTYEKENIDTIRNSLENLHFEYWLADYQQEGELRVCDGEQWNMIIKYDDGTQLKIGGDNTYPEKWNALLEFFGIDYDDEDNKDDKYKRQPGEVIYCSVSLNGGRTYYYTTEDESIQIGDMIVVPVGMDNNEMRGEVKDIEYFLPEDVPIPLERTKKIIRKGTVDDFDNYIDYMETQDDERQFIVINDSPSIDVLDESLYSYDSTVFALTPAVQHKASEGLINKVKQFVDSVPAALKAKDYVRSKTEYTPRFELITGDIQQALQNGTAEVIPCKDSANAFYLQIRTTIKGLVINGKEYGKNRKIKDIPIGTKQVPTDVAGAMQCLALQNQLNQIANGLREISEACEFNFGRVIQGQRDDRLAKLLISRSCFVQALAMSDESLQKHMLLKAVCDANSARAELAFQIKSDILLLGGDKSPKSKDMEKIVCDINTAIVAMNNAVQLSLYSYQVLGEHASQLAVVKEHETFIKQVLLKKIGNKGNKHLAWELICSSGNSRQTPRDFGKLPVKLIESCKAFIEGNSESTTKLLEGKSNG